MKFNGVLQHFVSAVRDTAYNQGWQAFGLLFWYKMPERIAAP
jgi:hypothetical protein